MSAQEAVAVFRARGMTREVAACERALQKLAGERSQGLAKAAETVTLPPEEKKGPKDRLRGVSTSLLEKVSSACAVGKSVSSQPLCSPQIRAKEAAKAAELLVRGGPEWRQRQEMVSRLPDMAMHTWNLFATNRKPVLSVSFLCEKIADSHPSGLSPSEFAAEELLLFVPSTSSLVFFCRWHSRPPSAARGVRARLAGAVAMDDAARAHSGHEAEPRTSARLFGQADGRCTAFLSSSAFPPRQQGRCFYITWLF